MVPRVMRSRAVHNSSPFFYVNALYSLYTFMQEEELRLTQQKVSTMPRAVGNKPLNGRDQPREVVVAEVHPRPSSPKQVIYSI